MNETVKPQKIIFALNRDKYTTNKRFLDYFVKKKINYSFQLPENAGIIL